MEGPGRKDWENFPPFRPPQEGKRENPFAPKEEVKPPRPEDWEHPEKNAPPELLQKIMEEYEKEGISPGSGPFWFDARPRISYLAQKLALWGLKEATIRLKKEKDILRMYIYARDTIALRLHLDLHRIPDEEVPKKVPDPSKYKYVATLYLKPADRLTTAMYTYEIDAFWRGGIPDGVVVNICIRADPSLKSLAYRQLQMLQGFEPDKGIGGKILDGVAKFLVDALPGPKPETLSPGEKVELAQAKNVLKIEELRKKALEPLYLVAIQVYGDDPQKVKEVAEGMSLYINPPPLVKVKKNKAKKMLDLPEKLTPRNAPLILCVSEISHLLIFPTDVILFSRDMYMPSLPPGDEKGVLIGRNIENGAPVYADLDTIRRHMYVVGATGSGKSNFLKHLALELVKKYRKDVALWIIDPHGDLADELLLSLPEIDDKVYYFDPNRTTFSINPLSIPKGIVNEDIALELMASELMGIFEKVWQLDLYKAPNVRMLIHLGIRYEYERAKKEGRNPNLPSLYKLYLEMFTGTLDTSKIESKELAELIAQLNRMPSQSFFSTLARLQPFYLNETIRKMFVEDTIPFEELVKPGNIVIWRISKADFPESIQPLMMSMIVLKLWFVIRFLAMKGEKNTVILIVDEFQNLQELTLLDVILSEARKFGLHMVMAHQNLGQLDFKLLETVISNTAIQVFFRLSGIDTRRVVDNIDLGLSYQLASALPQLPVGVAVVKLIPASMENRAIVPAKVKIPLVPPPKRDKEFLWQFVKKMRERYGIERPDVVKQAMKISTAMDSVARAMVPRQALANLLNYKISWGILKAQLEEKGKISENNYISVSEISKRINANARKLYQTLIKLSTARRYFAKDPEGSLAFNLTPEGWRSIHGNLAEYLTSPEELRFLLAGIAEIIKKEDRILFFRAPAKVRGVVHYPDVLILPIEEGDRPCFEEIKAVILISKMALGDKEKEKERVEGVLKFFPKLFVVTEVEEDLEEVLPQDPGTRAKIEVLRPSPELISETFCLKIYSAMTQPQNSRRPS